jgi:hypothetical protein
VQGEGLAPAADLGQPRRAVAGPDERQQVLDHQARVAGQADIGLEHLAELGQVDVDVELDGVRAEGRELAEDAIVPARADGHDEIAGVDRLVGVGRAVHAEHAQVKRMVLGHRALAEQRVDHGRAQFFGEFEDGRTRVGQDGTMSDEEDRPLRLGQVGRGLRQRLWLGVIGHVVAGQSDLVDEWGGAGRRQHVLGQIDEHGAGPPGRGDVERLLHDARDVAGFLDQEAVLDRRVGDAGDVRLLEAVLAEHGPDDLAAENDQRHRIGQRREQARHRVGGARARGHDHHAGLAGRARVAVGHVRGALFVAGEDEPDLRFVEGVKEGDGRAAGQPEHDVDPFTLQALHYLLSARGHLDGSRRTRCPRPIVAIVS